MILIARSFVPGIIGSLVMVLAIYVWQYESASFSAMLQLSFSVVIGSVIYVSSLWMIKKDLFYEIRELITRR